MAHQASRYYLARIRAFLGELARAAGVADPDAFARQWHILMKGSIVAAGDLLPSMFKMNTGYFLIQMASERDKDPVPKMIGEHSRDDANGVAQRCYIGVTNPGNPRVESAQEIAEALAPAATFHSTGTARRNR